MPVTLSTTGWTAGDQVYYYGLELLAQSSPISIVTDAQWDWWDSATVGTLNGLSCASAAFFFVSLIGNGSGTSPTLATTSVSGGGLTWFKVGGATVTMGGSSQAALEFWGAYAPGAVGAFELSTSWNRSCNISLTAYTLSGVKSSSPAGVIVGPSTVADNLSATFSGVATGSYLFLHGHRWPDSANESLTAGANTTIASDSHNVSPFVRSTNTTTADVTTPAFQSNAFQNNAFQEATSTLYTANVSESLSLSESLAASLILSAAVAESVSLAEALATARTSTVGIAESVSIAESLAALLSATVGVSDSLSLSDSVVAALSFSANVSESVSVSEAVSVALAAQVGIAESVSLSESLAASTLAVVGISESVTVGESLAAGLMFAAQLADSISVAESLTASAAVALALGDTLSLSEAVSAVLVAANVPIVFLVCTMAGNSQVSVSLATNVTGAATIASNAAVAATESSSVSLGAQMAGNVLLTTTMEP